ncbi:MAG: aminotransferase class V-fold PLP-dependent enzyme [Gammaproteobacteria bacterium]|nr:aminotransferase class V-fold PLP-dependent enzyme [Gammaproteobacteria bacterium]
MIYLPAEFPQDPELCYLNHAAVGPWPKRTAQTVANFAQQNMVEGATHYPEWLEVERRLRARLARLINAPSGDDIALVKNTSEGLSIVSQGLDWRDGDEVVGLRGDFCSNEMVWQALDVRGVRYQAVDALASDDPEGALIAAIGERTRLMAISTVHFATGYRFDMQRLADACREHGVLLSVDAIQSLGAVTFDLAQVDADFVMAGGHKWLLSPEGLGFFYCRPSLKDALQLHQFGWAMREEPYAFESRDWVPAESARRFESGTPNMIGIHAMEASLSLFEEVGMDVVAQRVATNVQYLDDRLTELEGIEIVTPAGADRRAGILTFRHRGLAPGVLHEALMSHRVICSPRAGGVRLAPHFYTQQTVLDRCIATIQQCIQDMKN